MSGYKVKPSCAFASAKALSTLSVRKSAALRGWLTRMLLLYRKNGIRDLAGRAGNEIPGSAVSLVSVPCCASGCLGEQDRG